MSQICRLVGLAVFLVCVSSTPGLPLIDSPRYAFFDRARVVHVVAPNLLKLKLLRDDRVVTVRLLGVGSPRNRDRIRHLGPEFLGYIARENIWEAAREYVESVIKDEIVEVYTRAWDRYDEKHRLLAYIVVPSGSREPLDLNGNLIEKGLGFVTRDYVHVTFVRYRDLEEEAKRNRRGLWGALSLERVSSLAK